MWKLPLLSGILIFNIRKTKFIKFKQFLQYLYYKTFSYCPMGCYMKNYSQALTFRVYVSEGYVAGLAFFWDLLTNKITDSNWLFIIPFRLPPCRSRNKDLFADAGNTGKSEFLSAADPILYLISGVTLYSFLSVEPSDVVCLPVHSPLDCISLPPPSPADFLLQRCRVYP